MKEIEAERAKKRIIASQNNNTAKAATENFPEQDSTQNGEARDIAAEKTKSGKSGRTLDESLKVVKYAEAIKDEKERNKAKVFEMWLACETQESIAEAVGVGETTVERWIQNFPQSLETKVWGKFNFQDDFQIPIYNVWKLQTKTNKVSHFGIDER